MYRQTKFPNKSQMADQWLWQLSIACFILAGLTGFLYRLGMLGWLPGELSLGNIRHAHSHLMFFGWAVPLPMYIIMQKIMIAGKVDTSAYRWMKNGIAATLFFGVCAYPFFLLYGYRPVAIGSVSLPLSVIFSGFVMLSWYVFFVGYYKSRNLLKEQQSLPWVDGAMVLLGVCSLGAWGVAVVQEVAPESHLFMKSMTHFFLAAFTEGWVVLVLLSILISVLDLNEANWIVSPQMALGAIAIGAPLTFPYGISESLLTPMLLGTARFGGGLAALGLLAVLAAIIKSSKWRYPIWNWVVALLVIKGVMQLAASIIPSSFWLSDPGLRVLYLHILLLGGLTLLAVGWLRDRFEISKWYVHGMAVSVIITLFTLVTVTEIWPQVWSGIWIIYALAAGALLPILAVLVFWMRMMTEK